MSIIGKDQSDRLLMVVSENGYGKRTVLKEYKAQKRGGMGIRTAKATTKTGDLVSARVVKSNTKKDLLIISDGGQVIRIGASSVSKLSRATQGVRIMRFKKAGDHVSSVALIDPEQKEKDLEEVEKVVEEATREATEKPKDEKKDLRVLKASTDKKKPGAKKK
jgi:DNA gyrase subunit A